MGSLFSVPKVPSTPSVIYSSPAPSATPSGTAAGTATDSSNADAEKVQSIVRRKSLPDTVLTSFRGVLAPGDWVPQRKNLLGE